MNIKPRAPALIDSLPDDATWSDLKYAVYVVEQIELGRQSAREGRGVSTEVAFAEFELSEADTMRA
jgi:hypothetical protein